MQDGTHGMSIVLALLLVFYLSSLFFLPVYPCVYRLAWCSVIRTVHDFPTALLMPQSCSCHTGRPRSATRCQLLHWSIIH